MGFLSSYLSPSGDVLPIHSMPMRHGVSRL